MERQTLGNEVRTLVWRAGSRANHSQLGGGSGVSDTVRCRADVELRYGLFPVPIADAAAWRLV